MKLAKKSDECEWAGKQGSVWGCVLLLGKLGEELLVCVCRY